MALKFLNKKGWHTGSLKNLEIVWKAEQKHEAEQKKLEELRLQLHKERDAEALRNLQIEAGLVPRPDRLEFLYDSGVGVRGGASSSSKPSTTTDEPSSTEPGKQTKAEKPSGETLAPAIPGALFSGSNVVSANDEWRKIHNDPLFLIKQQEQAALDRIRKNPVKMQMLRSQARKNLEPEKSKGEADRKKHKERKHERKGDDRHRRKHERHENDHHRRKHDREEDKGDRRKHEREQDANFARKHQWDEDDHHKRKHERDEDEGDRRKHEREQSAHHGRKHERKEDGIDGRKREREEDDHHKRKHERIEDENKRRKRERDEDEQHRSKQDRKEDENRRRRHEREEHEYRRTTDKAHEAARSIDRAS